jgi:hypothetical protein
MAQPGYRESSAHRAQLSVPHPLPALVISDASGATLVAPWSSGSRPTPLQAEAFAAAQARLETAWREGERVPGVAWITGDAITAVPSPVDPSWLQRRAYDGCAVRVTRPEAGASSRRPVLEGRLPVTGSAIWRSVAARFG